MRREKILTILSDIIPLTEITKILCLYKENLCLAVKRKKEERLLITKEKREEDLIDTRRSNLREQVSRFFIKLIKCGAYAG